MLACRLRLCDLKLCRRLVRLVAILSCVALWLEPNGAVRAHEFWIEPSSYQPVAGSVVTADLLIGTDFLGSAGIYVPDQIDAFDLISATAGARRKIVGRYGDRPAGKFTVSESGLAIILHQTAPTYLTYSAAEKFDGFAREKGFPEALKQHRQRGLSPDSIRERYQRFAKSLISVGGQTGGTEADGYFGMRLELVAETNPYDKTPPATMTVRLVENGTAKAGAKVTVFTRHSPRHVVHHSFITDSGGRVTFPLEPGRDYLVDSVDLLPLDNATEPEGAMWESLWASLVFHVPQR